MVGEKYYIIAGNYQEYALFIKRKTDQLWKEGQTSVSLSHFVYVSGEHSLLGVSNPVGFFIGTWRERKDIEHIFHLLLNHSGIGPKRTKIYNLFDEWIKTHGK